MKRMQLRDPGSSNWRVYQRAMGRKHPVTIRSVEKTIIIIPGSSDHPF